MRFPGADAEVLEPSTVSDAMVGTEFILSGLKRKDVDTAKGFFLKYSGDVELEPTRYGSVLQREGKAARIYVNGLRVAEEPIERLHTLNRNNVLGSYT